MPTSQIDCSTISLLLEPYVDGELGRVTRDAVGSHLSTCPACAAQLAQLNQLHEAVLAWPELAQAELSLLDEARTELQASPSWQSLTRVKAQASRRRLPRLGRAWLGRRPGPLMVIGEARRVRRLSTLSRPPTAAGQEPAAPSSRPRTRGKLAPAAGSMFRRAALTWSGVQAVRANSARLVRRVVATLSRYRREAISMG